MKKARIDCGPSHENNGEGKSEDSILEFTVKTEEIDADEITVNSADEENLDDFEQRFNLMQHFQGFPQNPVPFINNLNQLSSQRFGNFQENVVYNALEGCVHNGILDTYAAGKVIVDSLLLNRTDITEGYKNFIEDYRETISGGRFPTPEVFLESNFYQYSHHGNQLYLNFVNLGPATSTTAVSQEEKNKAYEQLAGTVFNVKTEFSYPTSTPFSGEVVKMIELPRVSPNPQVTMKRYLVAMIGRACKEPRNIQQVTWSLPGENRSNKQMAFPTALYYDFQQFFLEFFNIDAIELEAKAWRSEFQGLPCLEGLTPLSAQKKEYRRLSYSRSVFLETGFRKAFREALNELRYASYREPEEGRTFGEWVYRKRGKKNEDKPDDPVKPD